jgi:hypothetical protein
MIYTYTAVRGRGAGGLSMTVSEALGGLVGEWSGVNRLRIMPTDPFRDSASRAMVTLPGQGQFVSIAYTWAEAGEPQDGLILIGDGSAPREVSAIWLDAWHQHPQWMTCHGAIDETGVVRIAGTYGDEPEAWGWRIAVDSDNGALRIVMANLPPGVEAYDVVYATYQRATSE